MLRPTLHVALLLVVTIAATMGFARSAQANEEDKVLHHAVFFKFKDSSTEEDVKEVLVAFEGLKDSIDAIIDFEWGERINADQISGGSTHCFILTFRDEAGRDAYLPHPEHKKFGQLVGPQLEDVFVIDYWGTTQKKAESKTLQHMVFFKFKEDAAQADVDKVLKAFAILPDKIDTIKGFEWGTNNSPEKHDKGFTHAFRVVFEDEEGLRTYGPHEAHQALVKVLRPVMEEVRVIDFWLPAE